MFDVLFYCQLFIASLAIFFNSFLITLVARHTRNNLGFYKWIIVMFAVFETAYSLVILLGMPVSYPRGQGLIPSIRPISWPMARGWSSTTGASSPGRGSLSSDRLSSARSTRCGSDFWPCNSFIVT